MGVQFGTDDGFITLVCTETIICNEPYVDGPKRNKPGAINRQQRTHDMDETKALAQAIQTTANNVATTGCNLKEVVPLVMEHTLFDKRMTRVVYMLLLLDWNGAIAWAEAVLNDEASYFETL